MRDNLSLRKGLGAAVGLHFDDLPAESQLEMMKAMTMTRHKKVRQTDKPHRGDSRFMNRAAGRPTLCASRLAITADVGSFSIAAMRALFRALRFGFRLDTSGFPQRLTRDDPAPTRPPTV